METVNKIKIKHALNANEALCLSLRRNSPTLNEAVLELSELSGLSKEFLLLHIDTIRNWI